MAAYATDRPIQTAAHTDQTNQRLSNLTLSLEHTDSPPLAPVQLTPPTQADPYYIPPTIHSSKFYTAKSATAAASSSSSSNVNSSDTLLKDLRPLPKSGDRKTNTKRGRKRRSTAILTDTPIKTALEEEQKAAQEEKAAVADRKQKRVTTKSASTSTKTTVDRAKKDLFKPKMTNKKRPPELSSDEESDQETFCLVCMEPYSTSRPGENWVRCVKCHFWAHECTDGDILSYRCHNCDSDCD
ncbi:hypothetical protein QE152_g32139 [Popillia japonica]|uniref:Uncharacterized protein n=1 Tax=Popillia japonica TaxID=7064 RepID=A0AAW1J0Q5_POPJA